MNEMLPAVEPKYADYENIVAVCCWCRSECVFNRVSDLRTTEPIGGKDIRCTKCDGPFRLTNDNANEAYQQLMRHCRELLKHKRYSNCLTTLSQCYEMFFSFYLKINLLYEPFHLGQDRGSKAVSRLNELSCNLMKAIKKYTFEDMRNLFIRRAMEQQPLKGLMEAENVIATLCRPKCPKDQEIDAISDPCLASLLMKLKKTRVNEMRNEVIHKVGYRPTREEAEGALDEARSIILPLTGGLELLQKRMYLFA